MRRLGEDDAVKAVSSLFRLVAPASRYAKHDFVGDKGISLTEIVAPVRQIKAQPRAGGGSPYVPEFTVKVQEDGFSMRIPRGFRCTFHPLPSADYDSASNAGFATQAEHQKEFRVKAGFLCVIVLVFFNGAGCRDSSIVARPV